MSVICFFILSGYVIAYSVDKHINTINGFSLKNYIIRRVVRIYPVAWGALFFGLLIFLFMYSLHLTGVKEWHDSFKLANDIWGEPNYSTYKHILYSIFLPPSDFFGGFFNVALWTLSYELGFYVLYGLIISVYIKYRFKLTALSLIVCFSLIFTWYSITILTDNMNLYENLKLFLYQFPCWSFITFFLIWLMGVALFYYNKNKIIISKNTILFLVIFTFLSILIMHYIFGIEILFNPYSELSVISTAPYYSLMLINYSMFMMIFIYCILYIKRTPKIIKWTAAKGREYSFSFYATHFLFLNLSFGVVANYLINFGILEYVILFIVLVIVTNIFAYYFSKIFENQKMLHKLFNKIINRLKK